MSAFDLSEEFGVPNAGLAGSLFVVPLLLSSVVEAVVLARSDHMDRKRLIVGALLVMAAGQVAMSFAPGLITLSLALTVWGLACGIATSAAEAALIAASPDDEDRVMARWGISASLGDLVAPILFGLAMTLGWRFAIGAASIVALLDAAAVAFGPPLRAADDEEDDEEEETLREAFAKGIGNRPLMLWLAAAAACTFLDEILVAFGTLHLRDGLGASSWEQGASFASFSLGGVLGLAISDRLLPRLGAPKILVAASILCALSFSFWLTGPPLWLGIPAMFLVGTCVGPMHPLATARAYAAARGRPGLVGALEQLFTPVDILAPLLVGWAADRAGLPFALSILLLQPLVVAAVAAADLRRRRHDTEDPEDRETH